MVTAVRQESRNMKSAASVTRMEILVGREAASHAAGHPIIDQPALSRLLLPATLSYSTARSKLTMNLVKIV